MTSEVPRLAIEILERFLPDNEPLTGDLVEAARGRSRLWLWRQVLAAVAARLFADVRQHKRLTIETTLVGAAMLALLAFHAVVAAGLLGRVLLLTDRAAPHGEAAEPPRVAVACLAFVAAIAVGRGIAAIHRAHRVSAAIAFSVSATGAAFLNLYLYVGPGGRTPAFVPPDAALHLGASMLFIAGLFLGMTVLPARAARSCAAGALLIATLGLPVAVAQAPVEARFEVTSIKRSTRTDVQGGGLSAPQPGGGYMALGVTLQRLISDAYDVDVDVRSGPPWASRDRFDVNARSAGEATSDQIRQKLRTLLAERFSLRVHTEARETDVFILQTARRTGEFGRGLRRTDAECAAAAARYVPMAAPGDTPPCGDFRMSATALLARGMTLTGLAGRLGGRVGRPVLDRTGIDGAFDIELRWTSDSGLAPIPRDSAGIGDLTPEGVTLFTALQEQLGLRLVPARAPIEVLVIDNAARPGND